MREDTQFATVISFPFVISRAVKGGDAMYHPQRIEILSETGRFAALINSIPTKGFGKTFDWSGNQLSRVETRMEYLQKDLKFEKRLYSMVNAARCASIIRAVLVCPVFKILSMRSATSVVPLETMICSAWSE